MWGSRPLLTVWQLIDQFYTLQRLHTFTTVRVKVLTNFEPNHACADQAQYHTSEVWLHRNAMKPLQRHAKAPTTHDIYSSGWTITLPSGQHLSKGCYPKRTRLYTCNPELPVFLSDKATSTITHLIKLAMLEPYGLWLHNFLGWFSMFRLNHMILLLTISTHIYISPKLSWSTFIIL
jgi:hypothetical protein